MIQLSPNSKIPNSSYSSFENLTTPLRIHILEFLSQDQLAISERVSRTFVPSLVWRSHYQKLPSRIITLCHSPKKEDYPTKWGGIECSKNYQLPCAVYQKMLRDPELLSKAARQAVNQYLSSRPWSMTCCSGVVCLGINAVTYKLIRGSMHSLQELFIHHLFSEKSINANRNQDLEWNTTKEALKMTVCMIPIAFIYVNPRNLIWITEQIAQKSVFMGLRVKSIYKLVRRSSVLSQAITGLAGRISELCRNPYL